MQTDTISEAVAHFASKLQFETDPSDVHADFEDGVEFVLVDSRAEVAWNQGRITGAIHLPTREIASRAAELIPSGTPVVVYCWGPGCNGSTRAALEFARREEAMALLPRIGMMAGSTVLGAIGLALGPGALASATRELLADREGDHASDLLHSASESD